MKNIYAKINQSHYSLGELMEVIQSCSKNSREATAAMIDLIASGRVLLRSNGQMKRVKLAKAKAV